jgi:crotonobetainyl-CoA:carnitine CoA-transferase CaiB-like acyl-CoA transferase
MIGEHVLEHTIGGQTPQLRGNRSPELAPNDCYRCAGENDWVAISVANDDEWQCLCAAIGRPDLATDERFATHIDRRRHEPELRPEIEGWTSRRSKREAMDLLQRAGVRAGAVLTGAQMLEDPHLNARGYYEPIENVRGARQTLRIAPYQFSETPTSIRRPAPLLGEHTEQVLREVIGLSDAEIVELAAEGITQNAPQGRRGRAR